MCQTIGHLLTNFICEKHATISDQRDQELICALVPTPLPPFGHPSPFSGTQQYSYYPSNWPFLVSDSKQLGYQPLGLYTKKLKMKFHSWFKDEVGINMNSFVFFWGNWPRFCEFPSLRECHANSRWRLKFALLTQSGILAELYSHVVQWSVKRIFK
jgi:hypothetical protein